MEGIESCGLHSLSNVPKRDRWSWIESVLIKGHAQVVIWATEFGSLS
jgi:hypothetical protein